MKINEPRLWQEHIPVPAEDSHKYKRGHALIYAAGELVGATNLAASSCNRIGAGLTTVIAPQRSELYQTILPPDIMVREKLVPQIKNVTAILVGPGGATTNQINEALDNPFRATCILDANAIPQMMDGTYPKFSCPAALTPHEGEFAKAFPALSGDRLERALTAAKLSKAIVVLKGNESIIADPDGRSVINQHASPWLAKAGTGDVLAGMITGLVAQGMPPFEACAAACWMHGEAGLRIGAGLIASDIEKVLGEILTELIDKVDFS